MFNIKISKMGGNVRIEKDICSFNTSYKTMKGKCSLLIEDKGNDDIKIYKIDNEKKTVCDFINSITNLSEADEERKIKVRKAYKIIFNIRL